MNENEVNSLAAQFKQQEHLFAQPLSGGGSTAGQRADLPNGLTNDCGPVSPRQASEPLVLREAEEHPLTYSLSQNLLFILRLNGVGSSIVLRQDIAACCEKFLCESSAATEELRAEYDRFKNFMALVTRDCEERVAAKDATIAELRAKPSLPSEPEAGKE